MTSSSPSSPPAASSSGSDARHAVRGGFLQLLGVLGHGLLMLQDVLVPRLFGKVAFGLYGGMRDLVEILARGSCVGSDKGLYRFVAGYRAAGEQEKADAALAVGLRTTIVAGLGLTLAAAAGAPLIARLYSRPELEGFLPLMAPAVLGLAVTFTAVAGALAHRRSAAQLQVRGIFEPLLLVGATTAGGLLWPRISLLAGVHGLVYLAVAIFALSRLPRNPRLPRLPLLARLTPRTAWNWLRTARSPGFLRFSLPVAALEITNLLRHRIDRVIVLAMLPLEITALYYASESIGRIAANIRYAFDGIAAPMFSEALHTHDRARLRRASRMLTRMVAFLTLPLATTLVALREDLVLLFGPEFSGAAALVPFHVGGHLANGILGLAGHVLVMSGRAHWMLVNQLIATAVNVGACWLLIPTHGIEGAAIAFILGVAVSLTTIVVQVAIVERVHPFSKALLKPMVAAALMYVVQRAALQIEPTGLAIAAAIAGGLATYGLTMMLLGLAPEERRLLARLLPFRKGKDSKGE